MAIQNDNTVVTKGDLKALYSDKIAPYLGANLMLGTNNSTYYSPDEKIIGVWSNAAGTSLIPLYQKTFYFTTPSTQGSYNVGTIATGAEPKHIFGGVKQGSGNFIEYNYVDTSASTSSFCYAENSVLKVVIKDNDLLSKTSFITVQYTKSGDAANSAVTTAGCYNINFPNTQPANTEIYFGNGLYGFRGTGKYATNVAAASNTQTQVANIDIGLGKCTPIVGYGGNLKVYSNGSVVDTPAGMTRASSLNASIYIASQGYLKMQIISYTGSSMSVRTSDTFDVWITYTK